jgi:ribosome recycling factor
MPIPKSKNKKERTLEDLCKNAENEMQHLTNSFIKKVHEP